MHVQVRPGHTEASVDLARLAGCHPAGACGPPHESAQGGRAALPALTPAVLLLEPHLRIQAPYIRAMLAIT